MPFPKNFAWGAATAAYQIEGAHNIDGKGPSTWDMMSDWPGKIANGETGRVACDHYHRYAEDVALISEMNLSAYRMSLSWPRILPEGTGLPNEKGLAFYDRLIDQLLEAGVTPWVTLFHWDYPLALFHRGGWLNRKSPEWFAEYTRLVIDRYSDRVQHWITLNEPQCFISGHQSGAHAPGLMLPWSEVLLTAHHALLAHGRAVQVIREHARTRPIIGWAPVGVVRYPLTSSEADIEAARKCMMSIDEQGIWNNTWFSDPVILGHYPEDGLRLWGNMAPRAAARDMEIISQPLDFYGANIYNGHAVTTSDDGTPLLVKRPLGAPVNLLQWAIEPKSLYWGPRFLHERYGLPVVITENGYTGSDWIDTDGRIRDSDRIAFTRAYLLELERAADDGVDIRGYFHWTLMDNFEWSHGYKTRFGLIHVDFETQKRTLKDSAHWYAQIAASNGAALSADPTEFLPASAMT